MSVCCSGCSIFCKVVLWPQVLTLTSSFQGTAAYPEVPAEHRHGLPLVPSSGCGHPLPRQRGSGSFTPVNLLPKKKKRPLPSFRWSSGAMQVIPLEGSSRKCRLPSWGHGPCRMSSCFCNLSFFTNLFKNQRRIWKNRVEGEGGVLSIFGVWIERY